MTVRQASRETHPALFLACALRLDEVSAMADKNLVQFIRASAHELSHSMTSIDMATAQKLQALEPSTVKVRSRDWLAHGLISAYGALYFRAALWDQVPRYYGKANSECIAEAA